MRVLLLHPDDRENPGPWSAQSWDVVVDLGRSHSFQNERSQAAPRVLHLDSYKSGVTDAHMVRDLLRAGRGFLIDRVGMDWWELISILMVQRLFTVIALQRAAAEISQPAEIWCTRLDWRAAILADALETPLRNFPLSKSAKLAGFARHYGKVLHQFSPSQIKQIFFDKYDPAYRWRSRFSPRQKPSSAPAVLIPSAYSNVSRMAASYAAMLPQTRFLLVASRHSAHQFVCPENVTLRELSAYARVRPDATEQSSLMENWRRLKSHFHAWEPLRLLCSAGVFDSFPKLLATGLFVRDAWTQVLDREPICSVLCGDDSNLYTRLPVMLAAQRNLPTLDFHHGALDGFYLVKDMPCSLYLAKSEMEVDYLLRVCQLPADRVVLAPPPSLPKIFSPSTARDKRSIILFSEAYEVGGLRGEDVYAELLPRLWHLARENGCDLVIKLHPFESPSQRGRIAKRLLPPEALNHLRWMEGPLTADLFQQAWFGITIESTTAIECTQNNVCCFLCRWLTLSPWEYAEQFARFGMGESLKSPEEIKQIPLRLAQFQSRSHSMKRWVATDPAKLQSWLTSGREPVSPARSAS